MTSDQYRVPVSYVSMLAITQIIGYGTLYYSYGIIAPQIAENIGVSIELIFAVYSLALFVAGIAAPILGKLMDRYGAPLLMSAGSVFAALTLLMGAVSDNIWSFTFITILMQIAGGMIQYQAAFTSLVQTKPHAAAKSITFLTLIAGFSSTLFWPIATFLNEEMPWQDIYQLYAVLNVVICFPLHYLIMRKRQSTIHSIETKPDPVVPVLKAKHRTKAIIYVSLAFSIQGLTLSAVLTHMVPMLTAIGLASSAVVIGAIFGPAQALSRLSNMIFGSWLKPSTFATSSAVLMTIGIIILGIMGDTYLGAVLFIICLGLGSGISSIAQGALPLWLFGSEGYGAVSGSVSAARLVAASIAPFLFSVLMESFGVMNALLMNGAAGILGILFFMVVTKLASKKCDS